MWPFSRKRYSLAECGIFQGFTDSHCHLLPGVDDGVPTLAEALDILRLYEQLGITTVWLTPHIMEDMPNTPAGLRKEFAALQQAYQGPITLRLAAEHMLDSLFDERLKQGEVLPIGERGNCLLVETSYFNPPVGLTGLLKKVREAGYYPLLAHPERYVYMSAQDYLSLKAQGIRFQLNLPSLAGAYGKEVKDKALWLLSENCYDVAGIDTHRLQAFRYAINREVLSKSCCHRLYFADTVLLSK